MLYSSSNCSPYGAEGRWEIAEVNSVSASFVSHMPEMQYIYTAQ